MLTDTPFVGPLKCGITAHCFSANVVMTGLIYTTNTQSKVMLTHLMPCPTVLFCVSTAAVTFAVSSSLMRFLYVFSLASSSAMFCVYFWLRWSNSPWMRICCVLLASADRRRYSWTPSEHDTRFTVSENKQAPAISDVV